MVLVDLDVQPNVLYEAGVAVGAGLPLRVIHRGSIDSIPFGLDRNMRRYESRSELESIVVDYCKPSKRTVFNLERLPAESHAPSGVPNWFQAERLSVNDQAIRLQFIGLVVLAAALFAMAGVLSDRWILGILGVSLTGATAAAASLGSLLPTAKEDINEWFKSNAPKLRLVGTVLLVLALAFVAAAILFRDGEASDDGPNGMSTMPQLRPTSFAPAQTGAATGDDMESIGTGAETHL